MRKISFLKSMALVATAALCVGVGTHARGALFTATDGNHAASADFELSGTTLTITLANTASADVLDPTDVLTGLFFNTAAHLTVVSASLNGSTAFYAPIINNVGEGWQYGNPVSAHGMNSGISAAGLGVFGAVPPNQWFYTPPVTPLDGTDYGILSAGDNTATGNTGVTGHGPLIKNSIQFVLTTPSGFSLADLGGSVVFQYGTALDAPTLTAVPEPTTMIAGALLLVPFGASTIRAFRNRKA